MRLKEEILKLLEHRRGESISGQALAERFGVSRSAVWKAVSALKNEGYEISSVTNRGYCLAADSDRLSAAAIHERLDDRAMPVYVYESIDSTNSEAKRRISQGERNFLVLAEGQSGGRGRQGKSFFSPAGSGLYMSYAFSPAMALEQAVNITSYAAVCAAEAIESLCGKHCGIKWVNDLYLDGKKVGGILTEAVTDLESGQVASVVLGLGINMTASAVPEELQSIVGFVDCPGQRNALCADIVRRLARFDPADKSYMDIYRQRSVVIGRMVSFLQGSEACEGLAEDILDDGGLVVNCGGERRTLHGGEISLKHIEGIK